MLAVYHNQYHDDNNCISIIIIFIISIAGIVIIILIMIFIILFDKPDTEWAPWSCPFEIRTLLIEIACAKFTKMQDCNIAKACDDAGGVRLLVSNYYEIVESLSVSASSLHSSLGQSVCIAFYRKIWHWF